MFNLEQTIFTKYIIPSLDLDDPNKDENGKGTLQRFVEGLAKDWDETVIGVILNLIDNLLVPSTVKDKFVPYLEKQLGLRPVGTDLTIRRKMLVRWLEICKHKGTLRSYQLIANALGFDGVEILQAGQDFSFDSDVTLDDDLRTFDLGRCQKCRYYTINFLGDVAIDDEMYAMIMAAIKLVEPIYARLYSITLNSVDVDLITIFVESNGDLIYSTLSPEDVGFTLNSNGDLIVYGNEEGNFYLDGNGNLFYNGN